MNFTSGGVAIATGLVVALGVNQGVDAINPNDRALVLEAFYYEDGKFTQRVTPNHGPGMKADWAAEINRVIDGVTHPICTGHGRAPYTGTTDTYLTNDWVGGDCPPLESGDRAEAVWTWDTKDGPRSISGTLIIE